jgi:glycosyltransferase involved in cell wall biosynthesis
MGLSHRVVLTGLVPPEQIPGLMRAMDVLVHPSSREGLPRTVPQALLSGAAVVAYDADGTREACIDRITGRLVGVGDRAALREAVQWMTDPAHRAATVLAGRTMCAELFDADRMVEALDHVYDRARAGLAPHPE